MLIEPASLNAIAMEPEMLGAEIVARAYGVADDAANPPIAKLVANGEGLRPLGPCHINLVVGAATYVLSWVARRRAIGWSASGAREAESASFAVTVRRAGSELTRLTSGSVLELSAAEIAALGTGPIEFEVIEQGSLASRPALLTLAA